MGGGGLMAVGEWDGGVALGEDSGASSTDQNEFWAFFDNLQEKKTWFSCSALRLAVGQPFTCRKLMAASFFLLLGFRRLTLPVKARKQAHLPTANAPWRPKKRDQDNRGA